MLFRIEASWFGENWTAGGLNGVENTVFRIGRAGSVADNGGESGQEGADGWCHVTQQCGQTRTAGGGFGTCDWIQCFGVQNLTEMRINQESVFGKEIDTQNWFGNGGQNECAKKGAYAKIQSLFDGSP